MTRKLLEWSDIRPTLLRAQGRSGVEYEIQQTTGGRWVLWRGDPDLDVERISDGWLADMKALAEQHEADALGPTPEPQRIEWTKAPSGIYWGVSPIGRAYVIRKIGTVWQLERFEKTDGMQGTGTPIDEGSLAAMKAAAQRDAPDHAKAAGADAPKAWASEAPQKREPA